MSRSLLLALATSLLPLAALGCGDDETADKPREPAAIALLALQQPGGPRWEPGSGALVLGCDPAQPLIVEVGPNQDAAIGGGCERAQAACPRPGSISNWTLRAPGSCGNASQCGYVVASVDGAAVAQAASTALLAAAPSPGEHTFRVELWTGKGTLALNRDRTPLADEQVVPVEAAGDCGDAGAPDAGESDADLPDAESDAEGDAPSSD